MCHISAWPPAGVIEVVTTASRPGGRSSGLLHVPIRSISKTRTCPCLRSTMANSVDGG
jgi:hypothetical protein